MNKLIKTAMATVLSGLVHRCVARTETFEKTLLPALVLAVTAPEPTVTEVKFESEIDQPTEKEKAEIAKARTSP